MCYSGGDRKVYVVGDRVAGVLRPWPATSLQDKVGRPFKPTRIERGIAMSVGEELGLEIYGVDLLASVTGPVVVDVNAFPGFKGARGAEIWLADHLLRTACTQRHLCRDGRGRSCSVPDLREDPTT